MFENTVLQQVKNVAPQAVAEFFSGTLFVNATESVARSVHSNLCKVYGLDKVRVSHVTDDEYAFDFVA